MSPGSRRHTKCGLTKWKGAVKHYIATPCPCKCAHKTGFKEDPGRTVCIMLLTWL